MILENRAYGPRMNQVDGTGGSEATRSTELAYLKEAVAPITPQALAPLRLLSGAENLLPALLFALGHNNLAHVGKEINELQRNSQGVEGWTLTDTVGYTMAKKAERLGILPVEDPTQIFPEMAKRLVGIGGNMFRVLQQLWENGLESTVQQVVGNPTYKSEEKDSIFVRSRILKALVTGFEQNGANENFSITIEQLTELMGDGVDGEKVRRAVRILQENLGLVSYSFREGGRYRLMKRVDDSFFSSDSDNGIMRREVYSAIEALIAENDEGFEVDISREFSTDEVRSMLQAHNPEAKVLRKIYKADSIAYILTQLKDLKILRHEEKFSSVQLTQAQYGLVVPFVRFIDQAVSPSSEFLTAGEEEVNNMLGDSTALATFMGELKKLSSKSGKEGLAAKKVRVLNKIIQWFTGLSIHELVSETGIRYSYLTEILDLLKRSRLVVQSARKRMSEKQLWEFAPFIQAERMLEEGGFILLDRENRTSTKVVRSQILAIGEEEMKKYIQSLPQDGQLLLRGLLGASGSSPILNQVIAQLPDGTERVLLIIKPGMVQLYKDDNTNPTQLDSNGGENLSLLINAMVVRIHKVLEKSNITFDNMSEAIRHGLVERLVKKATEPNSSKTAASIGLFRRNAISLQSSSPRTREELLFGKENDETDREEEE